MAKINIKVVRKSIYVKECDVPDELLKQLRSLLHFSDDSLFSAQSEKMLNFLGIEESDIQEETFTSDVEIDNIWQPYVPMHRKKLAKHLCKDNFCPHGCHD